MDIRAFLLLYTGCLKTSSFWQHPATCRAALPPSIHKSLQSVWPFAAARCWQNDLVFQPPGEQGGLKIICEVSTMDIQLSQRQFLINFPHYSVQVQIFTLDKRSIVLFQASENMDSCCLPVDLCSKTHNAFISMDAQGRLWIKKVCFFIIFYIHTSSGYP